MSRLAFFIMIFRNAYCKHSKTHTKDIYLSWLLPEISYTGLKSFKKVLLLSLESNFIKDGVSQVEICIFHDNIHGCILST